MTTIVYYEGSDSVRNWITALLEIEPTFRRLPNSNNSAEFTKLPAYVADILYLDKPDIIISGVTDGIHERPIFSIELAACTPQYQHAVQRFSRMMASTSNGCPAILIIPSSKIENTGGRRTYRRSQAVDYGAVRLMDIFNVPAFVVDWPESAEIPGVLEFNGPDQLPKLTAPQIVQLGAYLRSAIEAFDNIDYIGALWRLPLTKILVDRTRSRAYVGGVPTVAAPGGGGATSPARLDLMRTTDLLERLISEDRIDRATLGELPVYFTSRQESLVFYPTRIVDHSGDPYVGMLTYYDVAFCRNGKSPRDRVYNLVAYCENMESTEVTTPMVRFNANDCPFVDGVNKLNFLRYSYHLKHGCSKTKIKPIRIYAEIADLVAFTDTILVNS